ncbi:MULTISPECIES: thioredoxin family protein [Sphingobacterium]|jgi:thioredoxin-related protein|uniref:Thioredoxin fold domain-containing protein n=1 Tax=Sphingobacterium kitahiroshimense TaxID=470446 RepID=A0ABV0BX67_9SPHI|nr:MULTISPECIES: thioredoxin fold domain-containing protein [Sphingobacterium]MCS3555404.1 thioredoxin-related protein [Sphingobacterium sp. JUb21]MCW2261387.1 thioredoxin-related protein [Sphingobacterium kitahiroshimense]QQD14676.1 thioredoxin fold domain-containing protein [Sphingobacterium sp. UDSM-2020]TCR02444.1 thioredoxin-like protein [Sphingobacterium sp. JUb20]TCR07861.1 thioredoxin-like protein [Sphingobacterium sp. JUb78]
MKKILLFLLILPFAVIGQEKGITFEHGLNWSQIKEKAKKENKFIFVDLFTTWCGPCKYMSASVFPQTKVGDFFNSKFVNAKIQMDKTDKDSEEVKAWYEEAERFGKDYKIAAYPTFLIFNPQGELVHRMVGGGDADEFIERSKDALKPETQYYALLKAFNENPTDLALAHRMVRAANTAYDEATVTQAEDIIISHTKPENLTKECAAYLVANTRTSRSKAFELLRDNPEKIDALLEKNGAANRVLATVAINEVLGTKIDFNTEPNWEALKTEISDKYANINFDPIFKLMKAQYYVQSRNWSSLTNIVDSYLTSEDLNSNQLNSYAWEIFENSTDAACLDAALKWSKRAVEQDVKSAYLDTYANLLYKKGDKINAIKWQEEALSLATEGEQDNYQDTLAKMKSDIPTWNL